MHPINPPLQIPSTFTNKAIVITLHLFTLHFPSPFSSCMDLHTSLSDNALSLYPPPFHDNNPYMDSLHPFSSSHLLENLDDHFMAVEGSFYDPFPRQNHELIPFPQNFNPHIQHSVQDRSFFNGHLREDSSFHPMEQYLPLDMQTMHSPDVMILDHDDVNDKKISCGHGGKRKSSKEPAKRKRVVDKRSEIIKGQWTSEEDRLLVELVEKHGVRKWSSIAKMLPGRIGKQCRERWHNHLKPNIKKDRWSEEEDKILIEAHRQLGNKWAEIARSLPGRSENTIKNHWNATKRRQLSSSSKNSSNSKSKSPLQDYIKSIILNSDSKPARASTYLIKCSSSGSALLADFPQANEAKQAESCSRLKQESDNICGIDHERLDSIMTQSNLDAQMSINFDLQKEMDFMEMLSFGYI